MTHKADLTKQLAAVELAADDCLNIAVCKTIPIQSLARQSLTVALAADAETGLSDDPVFSPVRRLRDWSRSTARIVSERGAAPDGPEFSEILAAVKAVSALDPAGAFVGLVEKAETLQRLLAGCPSGAT